MSFHHLPLKKTEWENEEKASHRSREGNVGTSILYGSSFSIMNFQRVWDNVKMRA